MGTIKLFTEVNKPTIKDKNIMEGIKNLEDCGKNTKVVQPKDKFYYNIRCHNFVFKNQIDYLDANSIFHKKILTKGKLISITKIKRGDIIIYYSKKQKEVKHYGIVHKPHNKLNKIVIRSKWGNMEVFEHETFKCPYSSITEVFFMSKTHRGMFGKIEQIMEAS